MVNKDEDTVLFRLFAVKVFTKEDIIQSENKQTMECCVCCLTCSQEAGGNHEDTQQRLTARSDHHHPAETKVGGSPGEPEDSETKPATGNTSFTPPSPPSSSPLIGRLPRLTCLPGRLLSR